MNKTKEQLIRDFKKSNKERKEKIAINAGFDTPEEYLENLQKGIKKTKVTVTKSKMKGTFYIVDILDATGSMSGGKYSNSKQGILDGIKDLKTRKDVIYSLVEFIDAYTDNNKAVESKKPSDINTNSILFKGAIGSNTPLYYTVYEVINNIKVKPEDKVLINVYTDGGNNTMYEYQTKAAQLIAKVQKENFTITFVATPEDLSRIKHDINIDDSNTLATANTAQGFKMSMSNTRDARTMYFASAEAGKETLTGFYKKKKEL